MTLKRRIAVLTVGRSDFSILYPLIQDLQSEPNFDIGLWVGGAHFDKAAGYTIRDVENTGVPIWAKLPSTHFASDDISCTQSMADHIAHVAQALKTSPRPDMMVILGDRYEAVSIGLALVPANIPIAHISGGCVTEGAIDDTFRHCLTKIAVLHFCDVPDFARRIHQMGESPERIHTVGALGLDGISRTKPKSIHDLAAQFNLTEAPHPGYAIATLHPETRAPETTGAVIEAMIAALDESGCQVIFTYPNADPASDLIIEAIEAARNNPNFYVVKNFGLQWFYTAMHHASFVIGNSSSGIIEAASFGLPVVDIGDRQKGRYCEGNVVHSAPDKASIYAAIKKVQSSEMTDFLEGFKNPYGDGYASKRVVRILRNLNWSKNLATKKFYAFDAQFTGDMVVYL